jgi:hypothetical protein
MPQDDPKNGTREDRSQAADHPPVAMDGRTVVASDPATELKQYRAFVARVASERSGELIFNRSEVHAAIIVEYLFKSATREINILTQRLYVPVYGGTQLLDAAKRFLSNPEARLNIISEEQIPDDHPLIKELLAGGFAKQISRRVMTPAAAQSTPYDFAVADGSCFRFEPDKRSMAALVKFGDETFGKTLANKFQEIPTRKAA